MAEEKPNPLAEWIIAIRAHAPVIRQRFSNWLEACREEPTLIWQTDAVRYATYALSGIIAIWMIAVAIDLVTPPVPESAKPEATTADYHVICTSCDTHTVIHREFEFDDFPVKCTGCDSMNGRRAVRCSSSTCRGKWMVPIFEGDARYCPYCDEQRPAAP
ncbi:MAG: hypothetical protein ACYTHJ_09475 [Planctomycetota bacterium]|jgi:hypothetical protein